MKELKEGQPVGATTAQPLTPARHNPEWWKARNERRRERYAQDPEYRAAQRDSSRAAYKSRSGSDATLTDPRESLKHIDDFGKVRKVTFPDGRAYDRWCMTKSEVAVIFGRATKLFYSWVNDGRFPDTVLIALDYPVTRDYKNAKEVKVSQRVGVYSSEEVVAAVNALGEHLSRVRYYRADHVRERDAVFKAVMAARESIGIAPPKERSA